MALYWLKYAVKLPSSESEVKRDKKEPVKVAGKVWGLKSFYLIKRHTFL
jgi:hypothetical protein